MMAKGDLLFSTHDLAAVLLNQGAKAKEAVDNLNGDILLNSSADDLFNGFEEKFGVDVPELKELSVEVDQRESEIDVSHDRSRFITDRSRPFYLKGTEITFFIPFVGDATLFSCRPNSYTLNPPRAAIKGAELILSYSRLDHDADAVKKEYYNDLASIRKYLEWQQAQVGQFNEALKVELREWIATRRDRLLKDKGMVASLGFPMRRRADAPQTYASPAVRRKPAIARPASTIKPFKPEPALDIVEYEHILSVISNMVHVMERSPHAFKDMKEEDLRQHFLVQLNGQYEGQATGETFNFEGKTDILIRSEGKNIFIAECKYWRGPESLREAIDQVLGYASWRDTKTALLVFNRQKKFTETLAKIPEIVTAHPNFKRQEKQTSETAFRFVLHHKDDKQRELILSVLAFEVPV